MLTTNPHPGDHIEEQASGLPNTTENTIKSVPNAFSLLHMRTNYNSFHELNTFAANEYTELHNHFQGIQRLRDGQHFVISGGSKKDKKANLLICKANKYGLSPKSTTKFYGFNRLESAIGSNVLKGGETPDEDTVVGIYQLNKGLDKFWHAGGMDVCGDILAVPLENSDDKKSIVRFYDFSNPTKPKVIKGKIDIKGNSGGVALTRQPDGRFLCASWTDSDDGPDRFDFLSGNEMADYTSLVQKIRINWHLS